MLAVAVYNSVGAIYGTLLLCFFFATFKAPETATCTIAITLHGGIIHILNIEILGGFLGVRELSKAFVRIIRFFFCLTD